MSPAFSRRFAAVVLIGVTAACGGNPPVVATAAPEPSMSTVDRLTVRTGDQTMVVDSPMGAARQVERMIQDAGGYLERSSGRTDGDVRVEGRVPAAALDSLMEGVAALGVERRRHVTGVDVTDQYSDLEARLRSTIALRDRLQMLLGRAATLTEVVALEKEIARLQTEIDALQARITQLNSRAVFASLAVSLERKRTLGPLSQVGNGLVWVVGKLF